MAKDDRKNNAQREHDKVMRDIETLRNEIDSAVMHSTYKANGWLINGRAPRDSKQKLMDALAEACPDADYPKGYKAIQAKLTPIYAREGWGEVPNRDAINRAIGRRKRR